MDDLPEDVCRRIHALMPLRDATRMSCLSQTFKRSWRCHPNLTLSKSTLGLNGDIVGKDEMTRDLISKVDHILKNHSGVGMKKLKLELVDCNMVDSCYINSWLHIAVKAGIEELSIYMPNFLEFPCSVLFNGSDSPIQYLHIAICAFRPTAWLGCWRSLARLSLSTVYIADDELDCLLSSCPALERLRLLNCSEIVSLKIPCVLKRLRFLSVRMCRNLQVIESNAPNISTFYLSGRLVVISFGSALQLNNVELTGLDCGRSFGEFDFNIILQARTKLLSFVPNVETLAIWSPNETISTPMLPGKFLHLKCLLISLIGDEAISPDYDYLSLVSYLEASPCLETFILEVQQPDMKHDSVIGDSSHLRRLPQYRHNSLKRVSVVGFCSAKSLVELTCHIVENAISLERLTLDTSQGCRSSGGYTMDEANRWYFAQRVIPMTASPGKCLPMGSDILMEVPRALVAISTHIEGKVPPRVLLKVVEPCSQCHAVELLDA